MNVSKDKSCGAEGELTIAYLERVARMLKLLAHPHRLKIVEVLDGAGAQPVYLLMEKLGLAQAPAIAKEKAHARGLPLSSRPGQSQGL